MEEGKADSRWKNGRKFAQREPQTKTQFLEARCCCGGVAEFIREALGLRKPFAFIASLRGFLRHDEKTG